MINALCGLDYHQPGAPRATPPCTVYPTSTELGTVTTTHPASWPTFTGAGPFPSPIAQPKQEPLEGPPVLAWDNSRPSAHYVLPTERLSNNTFAKPLDFPLPDSYGTHRHGHTGADADRTANCSTQEAGLFQRGRSTPSPALPRRVGQKQHRTSRLISSSPTSPNTPPSAPVQAATCTAVTHAKHMPRAQFVAACLSPPSLYDNTALADILGTGFTADDPQSASSKTAPLIPRGCEHMPCHVLILLAEQDQIFIAFATSAILAHPGARVTCVVQDEHSVQVAKQLVSADEAGRLVFCGVEGLYCLAAGSVQLVMYTAHTHHDMAAKQACIRQAYRLLQPGGELLLTDTVCDRRLAPEVRGLAPLQAAGLSSCMYMGDLQACARRVGFLQPRLLSISLCDPSHLTPARSDDPSELLSELLGPAKLFKVVIRLFKLPDLLEECCNDYAQMVTYKGTIPGCPDQYFLDVHHVLPTGRPVMVCGNTAAMLGERGVSWLASHFVVVGDRGVHMGLFAGESMLCLHCSSNRCCG